VQSLAAEEVGDPGNARVAIVAAVGVRARHCLAGVAQVDGVGAARSVLATKKQCVMFFGASFSYVLLSFLKMTNLSRVVRK
jgi:hypothetical protein